MRWLALLIMLPLFAAVTWALVSSLYEVLDDTLRNRVRKRLDCPCCHGYPVCWVERESWGYPAQRLCSAHASRWAHIRDLEDEVFAHEGDAMPPQSLADGSLIITLRR